MKRLILLLALVAFSAVAMAEHWLKLTGKGTGDKITGVNIEAGRMGDKVRGHFEAKVQGAHGTVELRGPVVRFGPDPNHAHVFLFEAHCKASDGADYVVQGVCHDGDVPARDKIGFNITGHGGQVFRGETTRQLVRVERS